MQVRLVISSLLVLAAMVLAACGAPAGSEPAPSSSVTITSPPSATAVPSAPPSATAQATRTPEPEAPVYAVGAYLEVLGDGLAVRTGPGTDHPLVAEYLIHRERDPITVEKLRDSVRLPAGYVVRVELGPVVVDNRAWYAVRNVAQAGQPGEDVASWASKAPVPYTDIDFDLMWLAASEPGALFVQPTDRPASACPCYGDEPPPSVVATGVGDGRVGPWNNDRVAFIQIAASPVSEDGTCDFTMTGGDGS